MSILPAAIGRFVANLTNLPRGQVSDSANTRAAQAEERKEPLLLLPPPAPEPEPSASDAPDMRNISPRQFAEHMHELYLGGVLSWPEYQMVGFPSELHPRYDETIGALTGDKADPDKPRDMLAQWQGRVDFETRHNDDPQVVDRARRILDVLTWQGQDRVNVSA